MNYEIGEEIRLNPPVLGYWSATIVDCTDTGYIVELPSGYHVSVWADEIEKEE